MAKLAALKPDQAPEQAKRVQQRHMRLRPGQVKELVAGYRDGQTIYQLGERFGIDRRTVSAILKREGVRTRWKVMDEERIDQAVELYAAGLSLAAVAQELGTTSRTISGALKRRGVALRAVGTNQWT
ncbi:MAG: helix-turn-helix domain containing protein [Actinomycetota bacterium]